MRSAREGMMSDVAALVIALLLPGCVTSEEEPTVEYAIGQTPPAGDEVAALEQRVAQNPDDLPSRFALAGAYERARMLESASREYEVVARAVRPEGRYTRPWLAHALVELELDRTASAKASLERVLAAVPLDASDYQDNEDYRTAALLLCDLLQREGQSVELGRLRHRYVVEFGGDPGDFAPAR